MLREWGEEEAAMKRGPRLRVFALAAWSAFA
jgi:hypothetical protein